jgi:membrane fusion protein, type I secretion system
MTARDHRHAGPTGPHAARGRESSSVGPQGDALILELRRLQHALDRNRNDEQRGATRPRRPNKSPRPATSGKARAGKKGNAVRRALARCLERIGLGSRPEMDRPTDVVSVEQRWRDPPTPHRSDLRHASSPALAPDNHAHPQQRPTADRARVDLPTPVMPTVAPDLRSRVSAVGGQLQAWVAFVISGSRDAQIGGDFFARIHGAYERELRTALRVLIIGIGIAAGWATLVPLSAAVVLAGTLVVESSVKKIQHPNGGVVAEIPVHDGMRVNAGDLLVRLDETQVRAGRQVVTNQLEQVRVRIARLVAERDDAAELIIGEEVDHQLAASEVSLFKARASTRHGQKELLQSNISQFEEQIGGLDAQLKSKSSQLTLISGELSGVEELFNKGLVPITRMMSLKRDAARLEGERGQIVSAIAETKAKIGQAQLQIVRVDQEFRAEVMKDLRDAMDKEAELTEKSVAAQDQLDRVAMRAPNAGIVHQLSIHTIGGVVRPGDVIMEVVPVSDDLEIEARLPPQDIDQVRRGQNAYLRFTAFNQRTTPQLAGTVAYVSADLSHDAQTNTAFYTVRITLPATERYRLSGLTLVSGMPVEVFLQTGTRTMASYLFKPISDQFHRMFNER